MLGPVVQLELENPSDKVPEDVEISIRHFLTVPHSPENQEALDSPDDQHQIVKLTKVKGRFEMEVIDSIQSVTSDYFTTGKLSGQSLCWITSTGTAEREQSSSTEIVVTKNITMCSHQRYALDVWCVCPSAKDAFEKKIKERRKERIEEAAMTLVLNTSGAEYDISFKLELDGNPNAKAEVRKISHKEMCKYNGMLQLGFPLEETLGCECVRDHHCCNTAAAIRIEVAKKKVNGIEDSDFEPEWGGGPLPPCGVKVADIMSMDKQNKTEQIPEQKHKTL